MTLSFRFLIILSIRVGIRFDFIKFRQETSLRFTSFGDSIVGFLRWLLWLHCFCASSFLSIWVLAHLSYALVNKLRLIRILLGKRLSFKLIEFNCFFLWLLWLSFPPADEEIWLNPVTRFCPFWFWCWPLNTTSPLRQTLNQIVNEIDV